MTIKNAIKIAECVAVDYSGMTADEVKEMDEALDVIFRCAREKAKEENNMDDKKALELLKSMHRRDFICSECQKDDDQCKSSCEYGQALDHAIKALENSSHIIEALEELKDETLDGIVKFGIEKSIECIKNMRRKEHE